ncbi:retrovirus-related pol polyprotein from transposon TNT 1-94 [Tanacetum coccineum]
MHRSGTLPSNTIPNPRNEVKAITTRSGLAYDGPLPPMPPPYVNPNNEKAKEIEVTKDKVQPESSQSTANVQPRVDHGKGKDKLKDNEKGMNEKEKDDEVRESVFEKILIDKEEFFLPKSPPIKPNKPTKTLSYPSRVEYEKKGENDKVQIQKFWEMFKKIHVNITLADALILMLKLSKDVKSLRRWMLLDQNEITRIAKLAIPHLWSSCASFGLVFSVAAFVLAFTVIVCCSLRALYLGKFDGKADEGFFVGYSVNSKAFIVFNSRTMIVDETLHITFFKNKPNVAGSGPSWLFDINTLTKFMNYKPVVAGNQSNGSADSSFSSSSKDSPDAGFKPSGEEEKKDAKVLEKESGVSSKEDDKDDQDLRDEFERLIHQDKDENVNSTNNISTVSSTVNTASVNDNVVDENIVYRCEDDLNMPNLEEIVYSDDDEDVGAEANMTNLDTHIHVSPIPTTRIHKDHPVKQIIGDIHSAPQTRRMTKHVTNHVEPKKVIQALTYPSWIKAMQDELLQFKLQQGYTQEEGTDYDEVFAPVAKIEAIRLFLAYASFKDFVVYQMDVKSVFLYGKIKEEVYVCQPPGFEDLEFPDRVYKKEMCTEFEKMMHKKFQMSSMGELTFFLGLQVTQKDDGIFISQDKYVDEILKKFDFSTVKITSTSMETLMKDENADDVDVHLYKSMIGSLMYLTSSRPDIMFAVCTCARFQVIPKVSHLYVVKRIFRYLKGKPKLGLWYPKDSPFDLEAYTDSDYAGASLDRKSITGGCQFLGSRLISWQCKKQTIVANSTTEAMYVAASNCCGHVLWIQSNAGLWIQFHKYQDFH